MKIYKELVKELLEKRKTMKSKKIDVPLFPGQLIIILSNDWEECCKKYPRLRPHIQDSGLYGHTIWSSHKGKFKGKDLDLTTFFIILNPHDKTHDITTGVLAHEATHFSQMVLEYVGQELEKAWEVQAYLVQWCVDELVKFITDEEKKDKISRRKKSSKV